MNKSLLRNYSWESFLCHERGDQLVSLATCHSLAFRAQSLDHSGCISAGRCNEAEVGNVECDEHADLREGNFLGDSLSMHL
jgi:hypothetical protein